MRKLHTFITGCRYIVDGGDILRCTAIIDQIPDRALFVPGDVGIIPSEPGFCFPHEHGRIHPGYMRGPALLRRRGRFCAIVTVGPNVFEEVCAPIHAILDATGIIG